MKVSMWCPELHGTKMIASAWLYGLRVPVLVAKMVLLSVKRLVGSSLADQVSEAHKAAIDWISSVVSAEGISCDLEKTTGWALLWSCSSHCQTVASCLVASLRPAAGG